MCRYCCSIASPLLLLYLPLFLWLLRRRETRDPEILLRPDPQRRAQSPATRTTTSPIRISSSGYLKPGLFRLSTVLFLLLLADYGARHIYNRGHLARVQTIHFARWVFLNGRKQLFFASNYDGSLESYMDDFINKVGWGLNLLFSNGVGYPRTRWLIRGGARERAEVQVLHPSPPDAGRRSGTKPIPGLTAFDLLRNAASARASSRPAMSDDEIREWLRSAMTHRLPVEFDDIQGIVRFGYGQLTAAAFLLLRIADAAAAHAMARAGAGHQRRQPTTAARRRPCRSPSPPRGCGRSGLPPRSSAGFSDEFIAGMAGDENRSRRLGDVGGNAPAPWRWGAADAVPHVLVMLYAAPGRLRRLAAEITGGLWAQAFALLECLDTADSRRHTSRSVSRTASASRAIDWERGEPLRGDVELEYRNVAALGEFLLGYPNEYGRYTDRPLFDPEAGAAGCCRRAEDDPATTRSRPQRHLSGAARPAARTFAASGSFLRGAPRRDRPHGAAARRERWSAARCTAQPLALPADRPIAGDHARRRAEQFTFDGDRTAPTARFGAHIRRANPRNADMPGGPGGADLPARPHARFCPSRRARRSGRADPLSSSAAARPAYGTRLTPQDAMYSRTLWRSGDPVRLPQRQHRAPVRVCAERLADRRPIRRPAGESDPLLGQSPAGARLSGARGFHLFTGGCGSPSAPRPAAIRDRARRRLFLYAGDQRAAISRDIEQLSGRGSILGRVMSDTAEHRIPMRTSQVLSDEFEAIFGADRTRDLKDAILPGGAEDSRLEQVQIAARRWRRWRCACRAAVSAARLSLLACCKPWLGPIC